MTILELFLMLAVAAAAVWGIIQAFAGNWRGLVIGVVVLLLALWILSAFGLTLPTLPTL